jgi:hypothetical protein
MLSLFIFFQVRIQERVSAMGGTSLDKLSLDTDFVIVKNVLAAKYKVRTIRNYS